MSMVEVEHVLVIPTCRFHEVGHFQGFSPDVAKYLEPLLTAENVSYRPRFEMEADPSFKQLIPYVIFQHTDENGGIHLFQYTRGKGQGEQRLHSKRSIGIGGHISSDDADAASHEAAPYEEGLRRELAEEVAINSKHHERCVGMINDDESEVGRVHLGVVHIFEVETPQVAPREDEITDAGFEPVDRLLATLDDFETWSQICLKALYA